MSTRNTLAPHPTLEPDRRRDETFRRFGVSVPGVTDSSSTGTGTRWKKSYLPGDSEMPPRDGWCWLEASDFGFDFLGLLKLEKDMVAKSAFNLKCWQIVCEKSPNPDVGVQIHPKPPHREQSLSIPQICKPVRTQSPEIKCWDVIDTCKQI